MEKIAGKLYATRSEERKYSGIRVISEYFVPPKFIFGCYHGNFYIGQKNLRSFA